MEYVVVCRNLFYCAFAKAYLSKSTLIIMNSKIKLITFIILTATMIKCSSQKQSITIQNCPSDGYCVSEILEDTLVVMSLDEYGKLYVQLKPMKGVSTLVLKYFDAASDEIADSSYREELYLPYTDIANRPVDKTFELAVIYGRIGNFRGQNLYFEDDSAKCRLRKTGGKTLLEISVNPEVPMKITNHVVQISKL